jgi:glycine betaine/choline ABC-type transport system substrate-binding protein
MARTGQRLVITDVPIPLTQRVVEQGVNAGMSYTPEDGLGIHGLVNLEDDLSAQPIFQPAPAMCGE